MKRAILIASTAVLLTGCAQLGTGLEVIKSRACNDPLEVRFARQVMFNHLSGKATGGALTGGQAVGFDCNGDGIPDNLGRWSPP